MDNDTDWIVIGRFGRPQGLKGFVRVISFTEPQHNIVSYAPWYIKPHGALQPLKLLAVETHNKFILAQVEGYSQREEVALLTNTDIVIQRTKLPILIPGEYYWHELIGMKVETKEGLLLGDVVEMLSTGSNDVLVVVGEKRHLIPYIVDEFIMQINDEDRVITADWDPDF